MKAMQLTRFGRLGREDAPLVLADILKPDPGPAEIRIRIAACGVCHTELDEIEGRLPPPHLPITPGHQVVGTVDALGDGCRRLRQGERVGVAWIYSACGKCGACRSGRENLCPEFRGTGHAAHGGYAEYMVAPEAFVHRIPETFSDTEAAPLLCAGAIGYRALALSGHQNGERLGLMGFGASAHLLLKLLQHYSPASEICVFARSKAARDFARDLGAHWVGDIGEKPPGLLPAVIDTTPAWWPVVAALAHLAPGGRLVINAIRKEAGDQNRLIALDYSRHLWMEKEIKSVANVTREDVRRFLELAAAVPLRPTVTTFPLEEANQALQALKWQDTRGGKVLVMA
jgi:propanol-preferring alcohol dehydrogenase